MHTKLISLKGMFTSVTEKGLRALNACNNIKTIDFCDTYSVENVLMDTISHWHELETIELLNHGDEEDSDSVLVNGLQETRKGKTSSQSFC